MKKRKKSKRRYSLIRMLFAINGKRSFSLFDIIGFLSWRISGGFLSKGIWGIIMTWSCLMRNMGRY
jgi:hypothetical protein